MRALLLIVFLCGATIISGRVVKLAKLSDCLNGSDDEPCSNTEVHRPPPKKCEKCGFYIEVEEAPESVPAAQEQPNIKLTDEDFIEPNPSQTPKIFEPHTSEAACKNDDDDFSDNVHNQPLQRCPVLLPTPANTLPPPTSPPFEPTVYETKYEIPQKLVYETKYDIPQRAVYETKYDNSQNFEDQRYNGNFPSPPELPPLNLRLVFENIQPNVPIEPANELHYPPAPSPLLPPQRPIFSHPCEEKPHLPCHSTLQPTAEQSQPCSPESIKPCYSPIIPTQPTKPCCNPFSLNREQNQCQKCPQFGILPNRLPYEWQREDFNVIKPINIPPPPQLPHLDLKSFFYRLKLPQVTPEPELPATYVPPYTPPITFPPVTLPPVTFPPVTVPPTKQPIYIPNKNEEHKPEHQGHTEPCTLVLLLKKKCKPYLNKK